MHTAAIVFVCITIIFCLHRSRERAESQPRNIQPVRRRNNPYRAASISYKGGACSAAKALGDQRFPARQAPKLPLLRCDVQKCHCRYVRHDDQRVLGDRRTPFGLQTDLYVLAGKTERRTLKNRRKSDLGAAAASDYSLDDIEWNTQL